MGERVAAGDPRGWTVTVEATRMGHVGAWTGTPTDVDALRVHVFGGTSIGVDGESVGVGGQQQQRLLALLVIRHGQVVTLDWLAENLWSDDQRPDAYTTRLRTYVGRLRQSLPDGTDDWITTELGGYRFAAEGEVIDHVRFTQLRASARAARDRDDPLAARRLLDEALALWRGDPFRELEDLDWARADIEQLQLDRLEMLEERWETELALGRHTQITGELGAFVRDQPLRERAALQYALALHRGGRTAEAVRALATFRRELAEQTGLEPSPAIAELERGLLQGDPALDGSPMARPLRGYRLIEEIGAGAFAVVWRAVQPSIDRQVAIKQIRGELASRPEFIRRFEAESRMIARIEHPHVVPLIDHWRDPDSAYLVMRWLGGGTLERRLDDGPLTLSESLQLAADIGGALSVAHRHLVVHRDVKPSNILFDDNGHAYLTDFGIALEAADPDGPEAALSPGSPVYAAPEQLRGEPVGPPADVFALGVVLYECLSGWTPFRTAGSVAALVDRQIHDAFPDLGDVVDEIPPGVSSAIATATAKDPADRFLTMAGFVDALQAAVPNASSTLARVDGSSDPVENPYVGLRAFDAGDVDDFFGRARLVDEIVGRLSGDGVRSRCVVLVGPSGSGKSSVARAGVVPAIRGGAAPGSDGWYTTTMVPGDDVFASLAAALLRIAVSPHESLADELRTGDRGILRGVRRCVDHDQARVVVVIDQFEEVFTGASGDDSDRFLTALAVALEDPGSPLRVVATIRADFYDRPLRHPTFARVLKETAVDVTPLAPDEIVEAITEPARGVGVDFEPGLVARISAETLGQTSPLPLLQFALSELFDRRGSRTTLTIDDFDRLGGLAGSLATRAETLYDEADGGQRDAIRRTFGRLTNPHATAADVRRRVPLADLGTDDATRWVLDRFGNARLLTFDRDPASREPTVEVAHEALFREWPRAARWLEQDRDLRRRVDAVGVAANAWDLGGRQPTDLYRGARLEDALDVAASNPQWLRPIDHDFVDAGDELAGAERSAEARRVRRLRRLVFGLAAALLIVVAAAGIAVDQQRRADREARAAESSRDEANLATLITRATSSATDDPEVALLLALEARRRSPGPVADRVLLDTIAAAGLGRQTASYRRLPTGDCDGQSTSWIDADGLREFGTVGDEFIVTDLTTGATTTGGTAPARCATWFEDADTGRRWAGSITNLVQQWTGSADSAWSPVDVGRRDELLGTKTIEPGELPTGTLLHADAVGGHLLYLHEVRRNQEWVGDIVVVDGATLEPIGPALGDFTVDLADVSTYGGTASSDAAGLFAVAGVLTENGGAVVVVVDAGTGRERLRIPRSDPITALAFDRRSDALMIGSPDGTIDIVDVASGTAIRQLALNASDEVISTGARPDGSIVAVGRNSVELFDNRGKRVGLPLITAPSALARVRPDGTVAVVATTDPGTIRIIDPTGGPLVERGWWVDPDAVVGFGAGQAGTVDGSGTTAIVDLASGTRTAIEPVSATGDRLDAIGIRPEVGGFLAWDDGTTIARWRDAEMVDTLDFVSGPASVSLSPEGTDRIGAGYGGYGATTVFLRQYAQAVYRFDPGPGGIDLLTTIASPPRATIAAAAAPDDALHLVLDDGRVRTYEGSGRRITEVATGLPDPHFAISDPATGAIAVGGPNGAVVVDPSTEAVAPVADVDGVVGLGFARDGALLVVVETDGTVRLWDTQRTQLAGTLWNGSGRASPSPPWYDASTDSVWLATSGTLLEFSLDPDRWVERACELVGRELTSTEWERFVPGDAPQRAACG